jgi:hypothetical protein
MDESVRLARISVFKTFNVFGHGDYLWYGIDAGCRPIGVKLSHSFALCGV